MSGRQWSYGRAWSAMILVALFVGSFLGTTLCAHAAVIFSDDFESGLSGWVTTGTPDWYSGAPKNGEYSVQIAKRESLQRTVSTQGYDAVTVSFSLGASGLSKSSSRLDVSWYNGSTWVLLTRISKGDPTADGQLHPFEYALPASAGGVSTFTFRVSFGSRAKGGDRGYLDDVVVSGTPRTHTVTVDKAGGGTVAVNGEAVPLPWSGTFPYGTELSLQAMPDPSYRFGAWTGDAAGSANPTRVRVDGDKSIVANFLLDQVVLNLTGAGGSVLVDSVSHPLPWSGIYAPGTTVTLEAVADAGHAFTNWAGDLAVTASPVTLTLDADKNVAAVFTVFHYDVTIADDGPGSVVVEGVLHPLPWSGTYDYGALVQIEAYPDDGYHFDSWSGDLTGSTNPVFLTVTGGLNCTAHFLPDAYLLSLSGSGGSVIIDGIPYTLPVDLDCTAGASVVVAALPDTDQLFWGWTGDITARVNPLTILMDADIAVSADFRTVNIFSDVAASFWAAHEIAGCYYADIVKGYKDGTYHPEFTVTRDQMAVFVARAVAHGDGNVPAGPGTPSFSDVASTFWAYRYIEYGVAQGIVQGYKDGTYHPERVVNRDQMAVYMARSVAGGEAAFSSYIAPTPPDFTDVPTTQWAYKYIEYCKVNEIVTGFKDGTYHPEQPVNRGQMAVYIARTFALLP